MYINDLDYYTQNSNITSQYTVNNLLRLNGRSLLNIQTDANILLPFFKTNVKFKLGYSEQDYQNRINENLRDINIQVLNYGFELRTALKGSLNFHFGTEWFESKLKSSGVQENNTNRTFLDMVFRPRKNLTFTLNSERFYFDRLDPDENAVYFLDLVGDLIVIKNKFSLGIEAKNLLNTKEFTNLIINDTAIRNSEYLLLPRFALLKATIRF